MFVFTDLTGYRPYGWNRSALDQLKASGALRQLHDNHFPRPPGFAADIQRLVDAEFR